MLALVRTSADFLVGCLWRSASLPFSDMPQLDWQLAAEIATTVSTIAFAASAIVVVMQLRQAARERYFSVTAHLFEIWQSPEFQHDQLFLLHKLSCVTWEDFCALGRGDHPERALHRVGGYYDRVGNLVRHGLIRKDDILPTIGGNAVAIWLRIEPLVKELRLRENAVLFENYEALLPECRECYVPGTESGVRSASTLPDSAIEGKLTAMCTIAGPWAAESRLRNNLHLDKSGPRTVSLRKWSATETAAESRRIDARAIAMPELSMPDSETASCTALRSSRHPDQRCSCMRAAHTVHSVYVNWRTIGTAIATSSKRALKCLRFHPRVRAARGGCASSYDFLLRSCRIPS